MAPLRSLGNIRSAFDDFYARTGKDAVKPFVEAIQASGGTTATPGDGFKYHFFTGPGTFSVSSGAGNVRLLLLGGGGGAGTEQGCGGGAAACIYRESVPVTAQAYPITIGNGGAAGPPGGLNPGSNGTDSTALGFTSDAGGSGGSG